MQVSDLVEECATHINDPSYAQISRDKWLIFLKSAARDLDTAGWLIQADDDSTLVVAANTFVYAIPQPFAYIKELRLEDLIGVTSVFTRQVPTGHWTIRMQAGIPVILFYTLASLESGRKIQIVGQHRPTVYTNSADTIDPGCEAFLRERTLSYGARMAGAGVSELAKWRQVIAGTSDAKSERMLRLLPQEFRVNPSSIVVPGRI